MIDFKVFKMTHLFFNTPPEYFSEFELPLWLNHKTNKWWFDDCVMKLAVGESIKSDFRLIKRIN